MSDTATKTNREVRHEVIALLSTAFKTHRDADAAGFIAFSAATKQARQALAGREYLTVEQRLAKVDEAKAAIAAAVEATEVPEATAALSEALEALEAQDFSAAPVKEQPVYTDDESYFSDHESYLDDDEDDDEDDDA